MNLVDELHAIAAALEGAGVRYAVCGGVAVTIHGATRSTKDIDLLLSSEDLPRALEAIRPLGYAFPAFPMVFDEGTDHERHVQRVSKLADGRHLVLDLLLTEASLRGLMDDSVVVDLPQGRLRVVSRRALVHMKRLAGRPQDRADLQKLEQPDEP
jgi:hypothetical protein